MIHKPHAHSNEPFHKPHHNNQPSISSPKYTFNLAPKNTPPSSPSSEQRKFVEELKEAHELSALLVMHLAQRNLDQPPLSPYSNCLPHSLHLKQVDLKLAT